MTRRVLTATLLLAWHAGVRPQEAGASPQPPPASPPPVTSPASPGPAGETPPPQSSRSRSDYVVGPGDVLQVTVLGNDDISRLATVQTNGAVTLPLLGEVEAAGLTTSEIQAKVRTLLERDYLVNPQVEIHVKEYNSQFVTVLGEVNSPGRKAIRGHTRLIDILVEAGGFTPRASGEVTITRAGEGSVLRMSFGGSQPTPQDQINLEIPLRNGDIITASQRQYVTVEGEVVRPSRYLLEDGLTVSGAVSLAGGLTRYAKQDVRIRRIDPATGRIDILEADLKDIRKGRQPDLKLLPNDVVTVRRRLF